MQHNEEVYFGNQRKASEWKEDTQRKAIALLSMMGEDIRKYNCC